MASNGVAYAVAQTQIGLAIESTRGTAAAPQFWEPVKGPKYKPDLTMIPDDTLQGSMVAVYNQIPGMRYDSHGWDAYPYLDSFPVFLRAELGSADTLTTAPTSTTLASAAAAGSTSISATASIPAGSWVSIGAGGTLETHKTTAVTGTGPYTVTLQYPLIYTQASGAAVTGLTSHQFSLLNNAGEGNQPPSVTITDYDGEEWRQLTAAQLDELNIKGNATGFVDYTCTWFANPAAAPSTPTPSYTSVEPPPGWTVAISIGGSQLQYVEDWEFDFKRGVKPIPALTGTQEYYLYFANTLQATGKVTVLEQSGAPQLTQYLAGATESLDFTMFDTVSGSALNLHCTNAKWLTGELDRSKEEVTAALTFQMLPSTNDATAGGVSPVLATVANAHTASY
jgi:hypothetical protein